MAKILVAEDDEDIRDLLVDDLLDCGYEVVEAEDGGVALDKVFLTKPDVILLDVMMPIIHGFDVISELRENPHTRSIPIVLVTALTAREAEKQSLALGVRYHITKPWDRSRLQVILSAALIEAKAKFRMPGQASRN